MAITSMNRRYIRGVFKDDSGDPRVSRVSCCMADPLLAERSMLSCTEALECPPVSIVAESFVTACPTVIVIGAGGSPGCNVSGG